MKELAKINEVTNRYEITARTLHYYEKMGLINSVRDENSGYRLYDEAAIVRLKQILILRKMNISIKDIAEIFAANNSDAVLSVFDKKIHDIDNDMAQLHELKEIVLEFVRHLRQANFQNEADIKMLFDKAIEIETTLMNESSQVEQFLDTSDVIDKQLTSVAVAPPENVVPPKNLVMERFEIVKHEPYRFIGKSVYFRNDWGNDGAQTDALSQSAWAAKKWIFNTLDAMEEYHVDMPYGCGLYMWDRYDDRSQLQGYIIGKFMKADTPVPAGMDYFDIDEGYIAKGWGGYVENEVRAELKKSNYKNASYLYSVEAFPDFESLGKGKYACGYFIACTPK